LVHNDRTLTVAEFQDLLRRDAAEIRTLLRDRAAGYRRGTGGVPHSVRLHPNELPRPASHARPISFVEHVFYQYQNGLIAQIWSMIDMDAIRDQLGVASEGFRDESAKAQVEARWHWRDG